MRYLIGIDDAKAKNDIAIFNSDMGLVRKPFTVSQSQSDIQKLVKSFAAIDRDVRAVVESTDRYHLPIVEQLSKERIFVSVANPKQIKQFGDNSSQCEERPCRCEENLQVRHPELGFPEGVYEYG